MGGILPAAGATGQTFYFQLRDLTTGQIANGSGFEVFNPGNWGNYVIAASEQTGSGFYTALVPGYVPAGRYISTAYIMAGISPALGDAPVYDYEFDWDGGNVIGVGSPLNMGKINGSAASAIALAASTGTIVIGAAASGTLTTSQITTNLTATVANQYAGRVIYFTSGLNQGVAALITAYAVTGGKLTFIGFNNQPIPSVPSAGDTFLIV